LASPLFEDDLPHPQWALIGEWIEKHVPSDEQYRVWTDAVDQWLSALAHLLL